MYWCLNGPTTEPRKHSFGKYRIGTRNAWNKNSVSSFTLVKLLVVMALIAILIALRLPP